jgi:hypothetical protein
MRRGAFAAAPAVLPDRMLRAPHRGSFLVLWDFERTEQEQERVLLRADYERRSSAHDPDAQEVRA